MEKPLKTAKVTTQDELRAFINATLNNSLQPKRIISGKLTQEAQTRIKEKIGAEIIDIDIDRHGITHAMSKPSHNLEPDDLLHATEVINTAVDISISPAKHKICDVLIFKKDIDGEITFLTEVHRKQGYLLVFDAWRQRKSSSRRGSNAAEMPPEANVLNGSPRNSKSPEGDAIVSHENTEKSSANTENSKKNH